MDPRHAAQPATKKKANQDLGLLKQRARALFARKNSGKTSLPMQNSNVNVTVANLYQTINYGPQPQRKPLNVNQRSVDSIKSITKLDTPSMAQSRNPRSTLSAEVLKPSLHSLSTVSADEATKVVML